MHTLTRCWLLQLPGLHLEAWLLVVLLHES
jgi:hypothetical protein